MQIDKLMPKDNGFLNWEWSCFSGESWPRIHELGPLNPPRGTLIMFCWIVTNFFTAEKMSFLRFRRDLIKMTLHLHRANLHFLISYFYFLIIYFICHKFTNCFTAEKMSVLRFRRDLIKMTLHLHGANLHFLISYFYFLIIYFKKRNVLCRKHC